MMGFVVYGYIWKERRVRRHENTWVGVPRPYLIDLQIHIVVKEELPDMGELVSLERAVREGRP